MVLLKEGKKEKDLTRVFDLHSNMVLLKARFNNLDANNMTTFTFQYGSIKGHCVRTI